MIFHYNLYKFCPSQLDLDFMNYKIHEFITSMNNCGTKRKIKNTWSPKIKADIVERYS